MLLLHINMYKCNFRDTTFCPWSCIYRSVESLYMKNLRFLHAICLGELNLKRALDEDTGVFSSFLSLLSSSSPTGSDSRFWEFHPSSVILGVSVFFLILIFCESLALYAKSSMCTCATKSPEDMKKRALLRLFLFDLEREREYVPL